MSHPKLYMVLIGCKPEGRHTEQHDIFFGIAESMKALLPDIIAFWPEANGDLHIDGWREVLQVDGFDVMIEDRSVNKAEPSHQLFFINLGGYKENEFDEFHYKVLVAAADKAEAVKRAKATAFYKHTQFEGAKSHIDDKYGVDVDDLYQIEEVLNETTKKQFRIVLSPSTEVREDQLHLGYFKLSSFSK
ncbi:MAG: DUF1543 domain-containing protein [Chitinophagaceae bacterium]